MPDRTRRPARAARKGPRVATGAAPAGEKPRAPRRTRAGRRPQGPAGDAARQQIVVSGVGGQGVLFIGRLLAEAAIARGLPVLASETHGMAQRGGTVIAHLKVGPFSSPLVRPGQADILILLKEENAAPHGPYLRRGGWAAVNAPSAPAALADASCRTVDADALARESGLLKAVNLIVLGRALAAEPPGAGSARGLFCTADEIRSVLRTRLARQGDLLDASLVALETGIARSVSARRRR